MNNKKGQLSGMTGILLVGVSAVVLFFVVGFVITIGANLVEDLRSTASAQNAESAMYNVSTDALTGFTNVSGFQPTIGLIIAAILIVGVLMTLIGVVVMKKMR